MRHRPAMSQRPTTCGLDRYANEMNWCHAGRYLFARSKHGSTTSTRSRNSTDRRIDLADLKKCFFQSLAAANDCSARSSGAFPTSPPPAEKATTSKDQAGQASTGEPVGGVSFAPERFAKKVIGAAWAAGAGRISAAANDSKY